MSKQLNLWKQETGEESFRKFITSILGSEEKDREERYRLVSQQKNYKNCLIA